MKAKCPLTSKDRREFWCRNIFDSHWNYRIHGIELYKNDLYFNYWVGGDSTDDDDLFGFDELPQYPGTKR
jgi:hypothetical protein